MKKSFVPWNFATSLKDKVWLTCNVSFDFYERLNAYGIFPLVLLGGFIDLWFPKQFLGDICNVNNFLEPIYGSVCFVSDLHGACYFQWLTLSYLAQIIHLKRHDRIYSKGLLV